VVIIMSYLVPARYGEADFIEKRSRFIGRVWRTESEAEALAYMKEMREKHWDAAHNVYAYSIRHENGISRYSDDGEPSGTGGIPVLRVFEGGGIKDYCCIVTRYFGGVLLGTGGLVRAYSKAAKLALENAGILRMDQWDIIEISCTYAQYERINRLISDYGGQIRSSEYGAGVEITALLPSTETEGFLLKLSELTSGTAKGVISGTEYMGVLITAANDV
jgi:uncharacterized YigZ family protein